MTSRVAVSQPGVLVRLFLRVRMSLAPVLTSARAEGFFESRREGVKISKEKLKQSTNHYLRISGVLLEGSQNLKKLI